MSHNTHTLLAVAAELRAAGASWAAVADRVGRKPTTCQQWPVRYRDLWDPLYRDVQQRRFTEINAEAETLLRSLMRDDDRKVRLKAEELWLKWGAKAFGTPPEAADAPRRNSDVRAAPAVPAAPPDPEEGTFIEMARLFESEQNRLNGERATKGLPPLKTWGEFQDALREEWNTLPPLTNERLREMKMPFFLSLLTGCVLLLAGTVALQAHLQARSVEAARWASVGPRDGARSGGEVRTLRVVVAGRTLPAETTASVRLVDVVDPLADVEAHRLRFAPVGPTQAVVVFADPHRLHPIAANVDEQDVVEEFAFHHELVSLLEVGEGIPLHPPQPTTRDWPSVAGPDSCLASETGTWYALPLRTFRPGAPVNTLAFVLLTLPPAVLAPAWASVKVYHHRGEEVGVASGVAVLRDGPNTLVLTNRHVCPDAGARIEVETWDGRRLPAAWLGADAGGADLAALAVGGAVPSVELADAEPPAGARVLQCGYGSGAFAARAGPALGYEGQVAETGVRVYVAEVATVSGDSGSGVFHAGRLVAVAWGVRADRAACVGLADVRRFVGEVRGGVRGAKPTTASQAGIP